MKHTILPMLSGLSLIALAACTNSAGESETVTKTQAATVPAVARPSAIPAPADVATPPADAAKTPSGLASKVITAGTGKRHPVATDQVEVHYTGWMTNGQMFDSSVVRGQTATFPLNGVIRGWTEGVQLMVEGEKRRFWIPAEMAYGNNAGGGRPSGMLVFDVELVKIH
jgi:FKBP-type peptidyl-prolyl cis-trans isomerase